MEMLPKDSIGVIRLFHMSMDKQAEPFPDSIAYRQTRQYEFCRDLCLPGDIGFRIQMALLRGSDPPIETTTDTEEDLLATRIRVRKSIRCLPLAIITN